MTIDVKRTLYEIARERAKNVDQKRLEEIALGPWTFEVPGNHPDVKRMMDMLLDVARDLPALLVAFKRYEWLRDPDDERYEVYKMHTGDDLDMAIDAELGRLVPEGEQS